MKVLYFGNKENEKIILVHGFQAPYQMWQAYIDYYKNDYCVVVPVLPGHGKDSEEFVSFENAVKEFEEYYIENFGKDVFAVYAISMGGVFATTLFSSGRLNIQKFIVESSPLLPFGKFIAFLAKKQYLAIAKKMRTRNPKLINKLAVSIQDPKLYDEFLNVIDNMSKNSIKNYIDSLLNYRFPTDIDAKETEMYYYYGGAKEEIPFKFSAKYIKKHYPQTNTFCIEGKKHCEGVIFEANEKILLLNGILGYEGPTKVGLSLIFPCKFKFCML